MNAIEQAHMRYVDSLSKKGVLRSEFVRNAFETVRRHRFLESWYRLDVDAQLGATFSSVEYNRDDPTQENLDTIYSDRAIVTEVNGFVPTSSTSQPFLVARMLEHLQLQPGMRALEIGTGTGYNAALLAEALGPSGAVSSIEIQRNVAERAKYLLSTEGYNDVRVHCEDGFLGAPEDAPFDRIVATVGCSDISPHWIDQLAPGGMMLIPLQHGFSDPLIEVHHNVEHPSHALGRFVDRSSFMSIKGEMACANPWQSIIVRIPREPLWTRPLPKPFLAVDDRTTVHNDARHQAFSLFLTFCSRDLWFLNTGYGLADQGTESALVVTSEGVEGYSATAHTRSLEALYERVSYLVDLWETLGCPGPQDYVLRFIPQPEVPAIGDGHQRAWMIGRPFFHELVCLQQGDSQPKMEG